MWISTSTGEVKPKRLLPLLDRCHYLPNLALSLAFLLQEQLPAPGDTSEAGDQDLNDVAMEEEQAPVQENTEAVPTLTRSSQGTDSLCSTAAGHTVPSTPTFSFK